MFNPSHVVCMYCSSLGLWAVEQPSGYISAAEAEVVSYGLRKIAGTIKDNMLEVRWQVRG